MTIKTEAFDLAYKFVTETNSNIFLTGKAGTGKTTFLRYLKEIQPKNMAVAAPTGVAAINAGGVTLHSMFQLPFGPYIPANLQTTLGFDKRTLLSRLRFNSTKINFFNSLELLVIDEASMVAAHTVDAIDAILRHVRHKQIPFGGVQVLFIGDLYQLQPVVKKDEWQLLQDYYSSIFFFDSHVLRNNIPVMIELKEIFRQKDESFIDILNGIRENTLTKEHLQKLNERMKPNFISHEGDEYITLTTHNDQANRINEFKLNRLPHKAIKFEASIDGEFPDHMIPAEKELILKKDAQVMFIKNDTEKRFFNGKIGIISSINEDKIVVRSDGIDINVNKLDWENITYSIDGDTKQIKENIIGTFTQYPLRLAWAITIHKSQGLTFDKVVIDAENAFANGQVYVALSRATTLEGMVLTSRVNDQFLGAHSDLKTWQQNNHNENSLPELFKSARESFMKHELFGVFTFDQFRNALHSLKKEIDENTTDTEAKKWHKELNEKLNAINFTANKFKETLKVIWNENSEAQTNEKLNTRVKDASVYFSNQLNDWKKFLLNHPLKFNNRRTSGKIDKTIEELNDILTIYMTKLNICLDGFKFNDLIAWKKFIKAKKEEIKSSYHSGKKEKGEKSVDQSELYDRISDFRKELAEENDTPLFMIFSNQAIKHCCELLPGDKKTLLAVDGFGKKKVSEYGDEVLRIIQEYCEDNNIDVNYLDEKKIKNIEYEKSFRISPTVQQTIDLLKSGKSISEICAERNLASSTIESHLANGIKNRLVDIESILPKREIETISAFFKGNSFELKSAREKAGADISFGKLKMVQAWLMVEKDIF